MGLMLIFWIFMIFPSLSKCHIFLNVESTDSCSKYTEDDARKCAEKCIEYGVNKNNHLNFCFGFTITGYSGNIDCVLTTNPTNPPSEGSFVLWEYFGNQKTCPLTKSVKEAEAHERMKHFDEVAYRYFNNSLFALHHKHIYLWRECRTKCEEMEGGFKMVSIHSAEENQFVQNLCKAHWTYNKGVYDCFLGIDVGTRDELKAGFKPKNVDGTPFDYDHFFEGEPNGNDEKDTCVALYNGKLEFEKDFWNDEICEENPEKTYKSMCLCRRNPN